MGLVLYTSSCNFNLVYIFDFLNPQSHLATRDFPSPSPSRLTPLRHPPSLPLPPIPRTRPLQIIHIQHIHPLLHQKLPQAIPHADRPERQLPVPDLQSAVMRASDLGAERAELGGREVARFGDGGAERGGEGGGGIEGVEGRVGFCEGGGGHFGEGRVEEDVVGGVGGQEVEGGGAGADDGDGSGGEVGGVGGGEEAAGAEGLEGGEEVGPEGFAGGFEVDEEDEGLLWGGVEDAVEAVAAVEEGRSRVLAFEDVDQGIDVEVLESAVLR